MTKAEAVQAASTPGERQPQPRILVVDDERSMRELLAIVLQREGYKVLLAEKRRRGDPDSRTRTDRPADFGHQNARHERGRGAAGRQAH